MDERTRLIEDVHRSLRTFSRLGELYGISRKTGYRWLARWHAEGPPGLHDRSKRLRKGVREQCPPAFSHLAWHVSPYGRHGGAHVIHRGGAC